MEVATKRFWMVYIEGRGNPTYEHLREADSLTEAARLVSTGATSAYVLEATYIVKQAESPIISERLESD